VSRDAVGERSAESDRVRREGTRRHARSVRLRAALRLSSRSGMRRAIESDAGFRIVRIDRQSLTKTRLRFLDSSELLQRDSKIGERERRARAIFQMRLVVATRAFE